ncbi:glycosyltransferase family 1 protein [Ornithinimicrobium panacihumi]|uniref:glycosyltransferase family 1 protein n=1 Tax=Ornithinimicrobium panacihumi TaxID=2008449 RepID=UPI003F8989E0
MSIRVRHIPAGHAYVEHLRPVVDDGTVRHLPDPPVPGAPPGQWWPHPALEPEWVRSHADEQDVVHLHFGTEARTTAQLADWIAALRDVGLPLVHTVHDLDHPHLRDQSRHREHLGLLLERADALLTLTDGAARRVERLCGRRPLVVPHPHVVPLDLLGDAAAAPAPRDPGTPLRVGLHLKSLRANLDPRTVLPALLDALDLLRAQRVPARLEVRAHPELVDPHHAAHDPALAQLLHEVAERESLVVAGRLDDAALWRYLCGLDVSVLPYAWATHSGWLEACRDLGTWVLAPDVGHLREQGPLLSWGAPDRAPSAARLAELLVLAAEWSAPRATRSERGAERDLVATRHAQLYAELLARPSGDVLPGARVGDGA